MGIQRSSFSGSPYQQPIKPQLNFSMPDSMPKLMDQAAIDQWGGPSPQDKIRTRQLQRIGLAPKSIPKTLKLLNENHDEIYHAGRLLTGKIYVITAQDKLYYGWPWALKSVALSHMTMNRCIDEQVRDYTAVNGLRLRIATRNQQRNAGARQTLFGFIKIPMPHAKQAPLTGIGPD